MIVITYSVFFLKGFLTTIWISWLALVLAIIVGCFIGMARATNFRWLRIMAICYIEFFRSIPILVMLFVVHYGTTLATGIDFTPFISATISLALIGSSSTAETVRAGLESVGKGQREAAYSSGFGYWRVMRYVVWPQGIRVMIPSLVGIYIMTLKDSSLAAIIGYVELTKVGLLVRETTRNNFEVLATVAVLYFIINHTLSRIGKYLERRFSIVEY